MGCTALTDDCLKVISRRVVFEVSNRFALVQILYLKNGKYKNLKLDHWIICYAISIITNTFL